MARVTLKDENGMTVFEEDFGGVSIRQIILSINEDDVDNTLDLNVDIDYGRVGIYSNPDEYGECQDEVSVINWPQLSDCMREY